MCETQKRSNSKRMMCTYCKLPTHKSTRSLTLSDTKNAKEWISCASIKLPFYKVRDSLDTYVESDENCTNKVNLPVKNEKRNVM